MLARSSVVATALLLALLGGCSAIETTYQAPAEDGQPAGAVVAVAFSGNEAMVANRLRRQIEDYMYSLSRDPSREAAAFDAAADLEELYRSEGFPDVVVTYEIGTEPGQDGGPERVLVTFRIVEGPLVTVTDLRIVGAETIDEQELRALWRRRQSGWLGLGPPIFVADEIDDLAADIAARYRQEGCLDVEVSPVIERPAGAREASVTIEIHEGPAYDIRQVTLDPELREGLGEDAPSPPSGKFAPRSVQEFAIAIRARLQRIGYPDPHVVIRVERVPGEHRVDVAVRGTPGRRARIAGIEVRGNARTRSDVILAKIPMSVGQRYDGSAEEIGLRKLYLTGLFKKARIDREWEGDDKVRLVVVVEEIDSRSLELMAGYGSYERLRGGIRVEERNVFGTGRSLALSGRVSQRGYRGDITGTDTDLFGSDMSLAIRGEYFLREEPSFTDEAVGMTAALNQPLWTGGAGRFGYTFSNRIDASTIVRDPEAAVVDFTEGRLFLELDNDQRDHPLFPRRGHEQSIAIDGMDPALGADVQFVRARFRATAHLPLISELRLVLRSEQGWLWPGEGSDQVPIQERFFNGGEGTVRSFREAQLGPRDSSGAPVGGEYFNIFSAELRQPVWKSLEVAAFADAGNVGRDVRDYGLAGLRYGIGAGLRLVLPIGPLRLDAAHNPDRSVGEKEWVVHFSIGYPF